MINMFVEPLLLSFQQLLHVMVPDADPSVNALVDQLQANKRHLVLMQRIPKIDQKSGRVDSPARPFATLVVSPDAGPHQGAQSATGLCNPTVAEPSVFGDMESVVSGSSKAPVVAKEHGQP